MRQKRYREAIGATTTHYKLYKANKNWLIAGIALFSFGIGAASVTQATPVAAATAITAGTAPATATTTSSSATSLAATSAASSAATDSVSPASEAASNATPSATAPSSSAISSAAPASSVASSTVTDSATMSNTAASSAATAGSSAVSTAAPVSSDTATTSTAASSAATQTAASVATKATTTNSAQYQTPPVKSANVQDDRVGAVQPTAAGDTKVTTAGINFTVKFNVKAGDTVTIKIDGADVNNALYTDGPTQYTKVDNVVMSGNNGSNVTTKQNQTDGAVIDTILKDGSYQQNFNLADCKK